MKLHEVKTITPADLTPVRGAVNPWSHQDMIPRGAKPIKQVNSGKEDDDGESSGLWASTYATPDEPGTAHKIIRSAVNLKSDAYFKYVSALAKNDRITSNPYFPKIYNVTVKQDEKGLSRYAVEMEALLDFSTLSVEEMQMLGDRMFFNFEPMLKHYRARMTELGVKDAKLTDHKTLQFALLKALENLFTYNTKAITYIKDPKLKAAMLILSSLVKKDRVAPDIHDGNLMIRRGPGGPQIVITDPVT